MTFNPNTSALPGTFPNQQPWPNVLPQTPVAPYVPINVLPHTIVQTAKVTLAEAFKPKRAGKETSHVVFVLDDSSSMRSCWDQTIAGYNEYLKGQKEDEVKTGIKTFVSLYKFDGYNVSKVFDHMPVSQVPLLNKETYNPKGSTNLNDAIGGVMMEINKILSSKKKSERESVIITILTDGEENSSSTFDNSTIKQMVEKAQGKNWGFMFLGANINAFHAGSSLGFNTSNTLQFNAANATETIRAASGMTSRMKSAYASGMSTLDNYAASAFTAAERSLAVGEKNE